MTAGRKSMNQEKVLIVEDEDNERTGLAELVSAWGYRAETARDGAEGLEKIASWSPSIIVTDMKMPRMGGLELLERIGDDCRTIAVIVVQPEERARIPHLPENDTPASHFAGGNACSTYSAISGRLKLK